MHGLRIVGYFKLFNSWVLIKFLGEREEVEFFWCFVEIYTVILIHLFTCAYTVWAIPPPAPPSFSPPSPPSLPSRTCSALFSNFVEEKT
jgi:hypothetical protein